MKPTRIKYYEDIGEVSFYKNPRAKRTIISIKPNIGVVVTVPNRVSYSFAEGFVYERKDWIIENMASIKKIENTATNFTEKTKFKTKLHVLKIIPHNKNSVSVRVQNGSIIVKYPIWMDVEDREVQQYARKGIERAWLIEAKSFLPVRVKEYAKKFGFKYKNVVVKKMKTRWGSCSTLGNLNFSLFLMRLPLELIDYVVLHELNHLKHPNHSKEYWADLKIICPESKIFDEKLRNYYIDIY